ncbi:IS110 family transposase [Mycobacterium paraterrae]|uniref:IS110 family transposase n=1 Tax=Mycobacterium paraterrae TaxID=577492 RepID=A0ABY3VKV0_9MYCO|nr:IS110 family transposase [Mycobacterium paraterrae]UMB70048.1 IS110 family transposase [Mycobacterium paraterrae]
MIVIGVDAHKRTHTMVAVDAVGKKLAEKTVETSTTGHLAALRWAHKKFGRQVTWALEDSRAMTARLERDLLSAGDQIVLRVPSQLMARARRGSRERGKSDAIDALATARAALREPDLPVARHHVWSRELKLLVDHRDDLVQYRTAFTQRLLWRIHELDPTYQLKSRSVTWGTTQTALADWLSERSGLVTELARNELAEIIRLTPIIKGLEKRLNDCVRVSAPSLLELYGCGAVTAARIVGETADVTRFRSEAAFARYIGLAPLPDASGSTQGRVRSHRGGNRQLNAACHQIAMIQIKKGGPAEQYYRRRRADRKLHGYAISGVKRRVARTVFNRMRRDARALAVGSRATPAQAIRPAQ